MSVRSLLRGDLAPGGGLRAILLDDLAPVTGAEAAIAPAVVNLTMDAGTTLYIRFAATYAMGGGPANLSAIPLTCLVKAHVWDPDVTPAPLATLTTANGAIVLEVPTLGIGEVCVPPTATSGILGYSVLAYAIRAYPPGGAVYDVQVGTVAVTGQAVQQ